MNFGNPDALWLLVLWPVVALIGWWALRGRDRAAARLGSPELLARLYPLSVRRWRRRRLMLALLATLLLMLAAARPQYGEVERTIRGQGINVMVALDLSRSMLAQDVEPTRLEAARESFMQLLLALRGNRVGVLAFAGDAFVACPMTLDVDMAQTILSALDTGTIGEQGTDIGRAIDVAIGAFERGAVEGGRALILITDGEDLEGEGAAAAARAAAAVIVIHAIGIGTELGGPIPLEEGGFQEDPSGQKVNTQMQLETLRAIAQAAGGQAFAAGDDPRAAIRSVTSLLHDLERTSLESRTRIVRVDRFRWFVVPALALLMLMLVLRPEPTLRRVPSSAGGARAAATGAPPSPETARLGRIS